MAATSWNLRCGRRARRRVVWSIHGPSPYLSKLTGLFFNKDKMIGADFEAGNASLTTLIEEQEG